MLKEPGDLALAVSSKLGGLGQVAISASFRLLAGEMEPETG